MERKKPRRVVRNRNKGKLDGLSLAGLSQLRTFFGFFALIFVVKRCVFTVAL